MKKIITLAILLMTSVIIYGVQANAQTIIPVQFAKGKSSASVKGNTGNSGIYYTIRARGGQVLLLDLSPAVNVGVKVEIDGTDGYVTLLREKKGGHYEIGLEESGEYKIFVGSTNQKPIPFMLTIGVRKMKDI